MITNIRKIGITGNAKNFKIGKCERYYWKLKEEALWKGGGADVKPAGIHIGLNKYYILTKKIHSF